MRSLLLFVPLELLSMVIVGAGLAFIIGARGAGAALLSFAAAMALLPPLLAPLFGSLPGPLLWLLVAAITVSLALGILRAASSALIGRASTDTMVGELAARAVLGALKCAGQVIVGLIKLPFRVLRRLVGR